MPGRVAAITIAIAEITMRFIGMLLQVVRRRACVQFRAACPIGGKTLRPAMGCDAAHHGM